MTDTVLHSGFCPEVPVGMPFTHDDVADGTVLTNNPAKQSTDDGEPLFVPCDAGSKPECVARGSVRGPQQGFDVV